MLIGGSLQVRSPRRVVNPEVTQAYAMVSQMNLERCQQLKDEQIRLQAVKDSSEALEAHLSDQRRLDRAFKESQLAQAQKLQIESFHHQRQAVLEGKKLPDINPDFHGYPNIPETPSDLRKRRKRDQQKRLKGELEIQMEEKREKLIQAKDNEKKEAGWMFSEVERGYQLRELEENTKKATQRADLWRAWKAAETFKKEQNQIFLEGRIPMKNKTDSVAPMTERRENDAFLTLSPTIATSLTPDLRKSDLTEKPKNQRNRRGEIALKPKKQLSSQRNLHLSHGRKPVVTRPLGDSRSVPTIPVLTKKNLNRLRN